MMLGQAKIFRVEKTITIIYYNKLELQENRINKSKDLYKAFKIKNNASKGKDNSSQKSIDFDIKLEKVVDSFAKELKVGLSQQIKSFKNILSEQNQSFVDNIQKIFSEQNKSFNESLAKQTKSFQDYLATQSLDFKDKLLEQSNSFNNNLLSLMKSMLTIQKQDDKKEEMSNGSSSNIK